MHHRDGDATGIGRESAGRPTTPVTTPNFAQKTSGSDGSGGSPTGDTSDDGLWFGTLVSVDVPETPWVSTSNASRRDLRRMLFWVAWNSVGVEGLEPPTLSL